MLVILWILGGLVAVVVLAMLLIPMFIDEQALIEMAQEQVRASTIWSATGENVTGSSCRIRI